MTTEPTTEQLLASLSRVMGLHCDHHAAIRARILAADRSGLWEPIADRHQHGHHYPTKFRRSDGTEYCAVAYWDGIILRWVTADTDLVSDDDAVAVIDPSRPIGGAS